MDKDKVLKEFLEKLVGSQIELDSELARVLNEEFWNLI